MIDNKATFKAFGCWLKDLKPYSNKPILATCDVCGKIRTTSKNHYRPICKSCARKGNTNGRGNKGVIRSEEWKLKQSAVHMGKKHTEEHKANISAAQKGEKNHNYKGGKELAEKRHSAKRRKLGYALLLPLKDGEVGHHITNEYVIGIPADVHVKLNGGSGKCGQRKHRTKVLLWLKANDTEKYNLVLCVLAKEH